jgi:hypothetical protein
MNPKNNLESEDYHQEEGFFSLASKEKNVTIDYIIKNLEKFGYSKHMGDDEDSNKELNRFFNFTDYSFLTPIKDYEYLIETFRKLRERGYFLSVLSTNTFDAVNLGSKINFINKWYPNCFNSITLLDSGVCKSSFGTSQVKAIIDDNPHVLKNFPEDIIKITPETFWLQQTRELVPDVISYAMPSVLNRMVTSNELL